MTAPIGRIWVRDEVITGWIKYGNLPGQIVKFAAAKNNADVEEEVVLVYPSKKKAQ